MQAAAARIAELEAELQEMKDRWMRAEAETANVRARSHREVNETRQYAVQKFAQDVVEAADNLHRGIDSLPPPTGAEPSIVAGLREGLEGIERNFLAILERNGIKREDPTGAPFDPNLHQAMAEQESAAHAPGSVMARLDTDLDAARKAAAPGDGGGRQGAARRDRPVHQAEHHRLMHSCRQRTRIPPSAPCPAGLTPIHPCHTDPRRDAYAVLRAVARPLKGA